MANLNDNWDRKYNERNQVKHQKENMFWTGRISVEYTGSFKNTFKNEHLVITLPIKTIGNYSIVPRVKSNCLMCPTGASKIMILHPYLSVSID